MDSLFNDILGHESVKNGLIHAALTGHLHHALLFSGPSGVGKAMLARAFVQAMFCEKSDEQSLSRCLTCHNCNRIKAKIHPDVIEIEETAATIKIEVIRDLQSRLVYAPYESARRFVLIHDIHKMQEAAANCFLKTLEEPPESTTFILMTNQIQRIIPTIISRCQSVRFAPFGMNDVADFLVSKGVSQTEATQIAVMSGGSLGYALELSSSDYKNEVIQTFEEMLETDSVLSAFSVAAGLKGKKDKAEALLKLMQIYVRDMLVLKAAGTESVILTPYRDRMQARADKVTENDLQRATGVIQEVTESFQGNVNELLAWERLLIGLHGVLY
ncbi:MAG: DNA polymerase III subunit delta' [Proteobacteria bacterium]|nr:DNA polymerase III subunit delta' [Pseudomonadota bacterium]